MKVLGIGYCAADILLHLPGGIAENRKIEVSSMSIQGGGPVATAMTALARWNVQSFFAGTTGDDLPGRFIAESFRINNVNTSCLKTTPGKQSAVSVCVSHGKGLRTILYSKGDAPPLTPADLSRLNLKEFCAMEIDGHQVEAQIFAARRCREEGVPVVLDAGSMRGEILPLLDLADHIVCSRDFADALEPGGKYEIAAGRLLKERTASVVITLGEEGSVGFDGRNRIFQPAMSVEVVDTVGAGDVYHAGYIYALLQGWNLEERMKLATACAGLKCRGIGGQRPVPSIDEALAVCGARHGPVAVTT